MLILSSGDIFDSQAEVIVIPTNTAGVMSSGIALQCRYIYPGTYSKYQDVCTKSQLHSGTLMITKENDRRIMIFPVKSHWLDKASKQYIESGLKKLANTYKVKNIHSIAIPKLGCENDELDWDEDVKPLIDKYLGELDMEIYTY